MDVRYLLSGGIVSSAALPSPPLPSDSNLKALRSASEISTTRAKDSSGLDPITLSASPMGDWLYFVRKRLPLVSLMFSTYAMQQFEVLAVRGGGKDLAAMRARKGSPAVIGFFEGIPPSVL